MFGFKKRHEETKTMFVEIHERIDTLETLITTLTAEHRALAKNIEASMPLCCVEKQKLLIEMRDRANDVMATTEKLVGRR